MAALEGADMKGIGAKDYEAAARRLETGARAEDDDTAAKLLRLAMVFRRRARGLRQETCANAA